MIQHLLKGKRAAAKLSDREKYSSSDNEECLENTTIDSKVHKPVNPIVHMLDSNKSMLRNPFAHRVSINAVTEGILSQKQLNGQGLSTMIDRRAKSLKMKRANYTCNALYPETSIEATPADKTISPQLSEFLVLQTNFSTTAEQLAKKKTSSRTTKDRYKIDKSTTTNISNALIDECYFSSMETLLKKMNSWDFNIFFFDQICGGRGFMLISLHLFDTYDFWNQFQLEPLNVHRFLNAICENYLEANPYHNSLHAADVAQALHCMIQEEKWKKFLKPDEIVSVIIAALCHDINHPGLNQHFLIETNDLLSNIQKGEPILENHHWCMTKCILLQSKIFEHLPQSLKERIFTQIKSFILATDITKHQEFLLKFRAKIGIPQNSIDYSLINLRDGAGGSPQDLNQGIDSPKQTLKPPTTLLDISKSSDTKKVSGGSNCSSDDSTSPEYHDLSVSIMPEFLANRGSLIITDFEKLNLQTHLDQKPSLTQRRSSTFFGDIESLSDAATKQSRRPLKSGDFDLNRESDRHFLLQIALKCSDISNPARQWTISQRWSRMICQELFNQGDIERLIHLPVTVFCDRIQTSIAQMQEGFLEYVVLPIFAEWHRYANNELSDQILVNITSNQKRWTTIMKELESTITITKTNATIPEEPENEGLANESIKESPIVPLSKSGAQLMAEYENIDIDSILWRRYSVPLLLPRHSDPLRRRSFPKFKKVKWQTIFEHEGETNSYRHNMDVKRRATIDAILLDAPAMMGYEDMNSFNTMPTLRRYSLFANPHYFSSSMMSKVNRLTRHESKKAKRLSSQIESDILPDTIKDIRSPPANHSTFTPSKRNFSIVLDDSIDNPNDTSFSLLNRNLALIYMSRHRKSVRNSLVYRCPSNE